jgi:HEAT repeat protein
MKRVLLGVFGLAMVIGGAMLAARSTAAPEQIYDGKPTSAWALALNLANTRLQAEQVLRKADSNAVPDLVRMLQTPDPLLARPVKALGRHLPTKAGQGVFRVMDPFAAAAKRTAAAEALRMIGPHAEAALPALQKALLDNDAVSWHAAQALAEFGPTGLVALTNALPKAAPSQAGFICYALGTQGPAASNAIPLLVAELRSGRAQPAESAARALSAMGRAAVPELGDCLSDSNLQVRIFAAEALGRIGRPARQSAPKLVEMAERDEAPARAAATNALAQIGPRRSPQ